MEKAFTTFPVTFCQDLIPFHHVVAEHDAALPLLAWIKVLMLRTLSKHSFKQVCACILPHLRKIWLYYKPKLTLRMAGNEAFSFSPIAHFGCESLVSLPVVSIDPFV